MLKKEDAQKIEVVDLYPFVPAEWEYKCGAHRVAYDRKRNSMIWGTQYEVDNVTVDEKGVPLGYTKTVQEKDLGGYVDLSVSKAKKEKQAKKKHCPKCKGFKKLNLFYRNRATTDGLQTYCKVCHKKAVATSTATSTEK